MSAEEAIAAVRALGVTGELVAYSLDDESSLGYMGWWSVCEDFDGLLIVGGSTRVVSPTGRVFEFGSIPPWVMGLSAENIIADAS